MESSEVVSYTRGRWHETHKEFTNKFAFETYKFRLAYKGCNLSCNTIEYVSVSLFTLAVALDKMVPLFWFVVSLTALEGWKTLNQFVTLLQSETQDVPNAVEPHLALTRPCPPMARRRDVNDPTPR